MRRSFSPTKTFFSGSNAPGTMTNFYFKQDKDKMDAAFEFITKMNLPYYCFHDVDVVDYGNDVLENDDHFMNNYEKKKIVNPKLKDILMAQT